MTIKISLSFLLYALVVLGKAFIFKKMDVEAWKAIIPGYSTYLLFKKVWNTKMFWIEMATVLVGAATLTSGLVMLPFEELGMVGIALICVGAVLNTTTLFIRLGGVYKLAKAFGHGAGYTFGLLFFGYIFYPILGFGQDQYQTA